MAAVYPSAVKVFSTKTDFVDAVYAEHVNSLQDEVNSVESTLGTNIKTAINWASTTEGSFTTPTTWASVKTRLDNLEYAAYLGVNSRVKTAGGSTVAQSSTTVGLKFKPNSGATGNQVEFAPISGSTATWVDVNGVLQTTRGSVSDVAIASAMLLGGM